MLISLFPFIYNGATHPPTNVPSSSMMVTQDSGPLCPTRTVNISFPSRPIVSLVMSKLVHTRVGVGLGGNVMVRVAGVKSSPAG